MVKFEIWFWQVMTIRTRHIRFHFVAFTLFYQIMSRNDFSLKPSAAHFKIEDFSFFNDVTHITIFCPKFCTKLNQFWNWNYFLKEQYLGNDVTKFEGKKWNYSLIFDCFITSWSNSDTNWKIKLGHKGLIWLIRPKSAAFTAWPIRSLLS